MALLGFALLAFGCGEVQKTKKSSDMGMPDVSDTRPPDDGFDVQLRGRGTGEAFVEGQEVELVSGFQGGYHIDVVLFVETLPEVTDGITRARVRHVETSERFAGITADIFAENWRVDPEGGFVYSIPPVVTDGFSYPSDAIGDPIELEVTTTMDDGTEARDIVRLVLVDEIEELGGI